MITVTPEANNEETVNKQFKCHYRTLSFHTDRDKSTMRPSTVPNRVLW